MLRLFDAQAMPSKFGADLRGQDGKEQEWATLLEMWWQFSVAWGLGGMLTEEGRKACVLALILPIQCCLSKAAFALTSSVRLNDLIPWAELCRFDSMMREFAPRLPSAGTIFDYCIDAGKLEWQLWEARLPSGSRQAVLSFSQTCRLKRQTLQSFKIPFMLLASVVNTLRLKGDVLGLQRDAADAAASHCRPNCRHAPYMACCSRTGCRWRPRATGRTARCA